MYFQLRPSTLHTEGIGYGSLLLKTPCAADAYTENLSKKEQKMGNSGTLAQEVATGFVHQRGLLLTPTTREEVQDLDKFQKRMEKYPNGTKVPNLATQVVGLLPTPRATKISGTDRSDFSPSLPGLMNKGLLPTPTASDIKNATLPKSQENRSSLIGEIIREKQIGQVSQQLNPQFVMEMMGYPTDWLELPFLNGETNL
jgi:hypothetical protein